MASNNNNTEEKIIGPQLRGMLAGVASGVAKLVVGHPFDTLKVRLQTEGGYGRFKGPIDCLKTTIKTEGLLALYKGATPPLFGWAIIDSVMVGAYASTKKYFQDQDPTRPVPLTQVGIAGTVGGWASVIVVTPIEQIKARLQVQYADPSSKVFKGPVDCVVQLVKKNSWNQSFFGLYQGFWGTFYFRSFIGVYFAGYEWCKRSLEPNPMPTQLKNFISGGFAATLLWISAFPFDVIKNRMMAQPLTADRPYPTVRACVTKIYQKEGWVGFWRGFTPCMIRSVPANGAAMVAIELVTTYLP